MVEIYVSAWKGGVIQARHLIRTTDETRAEAEFLRRYPQYCGLAIICEGVWE